MTTDSLPPGDDTPEQALAEPTVRDEARALFRASVLDAAEAEFAAHGFEGARMQDVARRARVAVGTVYNHFANKDELLAAVLSARGKDALEAFAPRPEDGDRFEDRFLARFARLHGFFGTHIPFFAVASRHGALGDEGPSTCSQSHLDMGLADAVQALLQEGIEEGALAPNDPRRLARFLKGASKMVMLGATLDGSLDVETDGRWVLETFLRGAAARPGGKRAGGAGRAKSPVRGGA